MPLDPIEGVVLGVEAARLIGRIAKFKARRSDGGRKITPAEAGELKAAAKRLVEQLARDFGD